MRSIFCGLSSLALALAPALAVVPVSVAEAKPNTANALQICRNYITIVEVRNLGECVSYLILQAENLPGFATHYCDASEELNPVNFYNNYDSHADCVKEVLGVGGED